MLPVIISSSARVCRNTTLTVLDSRRIMSTTRRVFHKPALQRLARAATATVILAGLFVGLPQAQAGQNSNQGRRATWWWPTGIGITSMGGDGGAALASTANISYAESRFVSIRCVRFLEIWGGDPDNHQEEFALMYGVCTPDWRWGLFSVCAGPAYNHQDTDHKGKSFVGLAYECQTIFKPLPQVGLGWSLFGDLNGTDSMLGFGLSLTIGWIH
ncbi:MAG: hypothetical protein V1784_05550 [bacterium]